jgi:DNA-directed RNA polymerase beta subunit
MIVEKLKSVRRAWDEEKFKKFQDRKYEILKAKFKEEERQGLAPGSSQVFQEDELMDELEFDRMMNYQISITYDREHRELRIRTDAGRPLRPLFIVEKNHIKVEEDQILKLLDMDDPYGYICQ